MNIDEIKIEVVDLDNTSKLLTVAQTGECSIDYEQTKKNTLAKQGIVILTEKEIETMPKNIRRLLVLDNNRCRLRTKKSGKNSTTYEIRFRRDGYNVSASGKTIELAKKNFLKKMKTAKPQQACDVPSTFNSFSLFYFENFRKEKVKESTLKTDLQRYKRYLQPHFKEVELRKITPLSCKSLLDSLKNQKKGKTADELYSLMSVIFKSAIAHSIITKNPLDTVLHIQHERKNGQALTRDDEKRLKNGLQATPYLSAFMISLYAGLRPNELKTAKIDGAFVVAENSKRKNGKTEYKKIPIIKALKPYVQNEFVIPSPYTMREKLNAILPQHILYDLRTTFHSRCVEYGVDEIARKLFMGHSLGVLANAYTDVSDEFLLEEAKKLDHWE